jgi:hypothetical protein
VVDCGVVFLKGDVIVGDLHWVWECAVRQGQIGYDVEIQNVFSVHEHDLAALRRIDFTPSQFLAALVISPPTTMKA